MLLALSRAGRRKVVIEESEEIAADEAVGEAPEAAKDSAGDRVVIPQVYGTDDADEGCAIVTREHGHEGERCHADREDGATGETQCFRREVHRNWREYSMLATGSRN